MLSNVIECDVSPVPKPLTFFSGIVPGANASWCFPINPSKRSLVSLSPILPPSSTFSFRLVVAVTSDSKCDSSYCCSFNFQKSFIHVGFFSFSPDRGLSLPGGLLLQEVVHIWLDFWRFPSFSSARSFHGFGDFSRHILPSREKLRKHLMMMPGSFPRFRETSLQYEQNFQAPGH